jgi:hypothetical protein
MQLTASKPDVYAFSVVASFILLLAVSRVSAGLARPSRGITAEKASRLATIYTFIHVTGCGSVEAPIARGAHWEVPLRAGVVGARAASLRVDTRTGRVSYRWLGKSYPTRSPKQLAEEERRLTSRPPKPDQVMQLRRQALRLTAKTTSMSFVRLTRSLTAAADLVSR